MKTPEFDVTVSIIMDEVAIMAHTEAGQKFLNTAWEDNVFDAFAGPSEFVKNVPPNIRVGLLNPETNLFAQLPARSLH